MANFEFAPWIHPPESIAKSFAQGLGIAADVQNQRAQLQQRQDEQAQQAQLERQRLAQEQQYRQQQYGISEQELMQSQQLNQLKIQDAQRRFSAQQQYQQDLASGVDPLKAIMENFPGTDESMTGYGQLARQMQLQKQMSAPAKPITFKDPVSGKDVSYLQSYTAEGAPHYQRMIEPPDTMTKSMMLQQSNYLREQLRQLRAAQIKSTSDPLYQMSLTKPESELNATAKEAIQEVKDRQQEISDLEAQLQGIYSESGIPPLRTTSPPGGGGGGVQYNYDPTQKRLVPAGGGGARVAPPAAADAPADLVSQAAGQTMGPSIGNAMFAPQAMLPGASPPNAQRAVNPPGSSAYGIMGAPATPFQVGGGAPPPAPAPQIAPPSQVVQGPMQQSPRAQRDQAYNTLVKRLDSLSNDDLVAAYKRINPDGKARYEDGTFYGPDFTLTRHFGKIFKDDYRGNREDMIALLARSALDKGVSPVD